MFRIAVCVTGTITCPKLLDNYMSVFNVFLVDHNEHVIDVFASVDNHFDIPHNCNLIHHEINDTVHEFPVLYDMNCFMRSAFYKRNHEISNDTYYDVCIKISGSFTEMPDKLITCLHSGSVYCYSQLSDVIDHDKYIHADKPIPITTDFMYAQSYEFNLMSYYWSNIDELIVMGAGIIKEHVTSTEGRYKVFFPVYMQEINLNIMGIE